MVTARTFAAVKQQHGGTDAQVRAFMERCVGHPLEIIADPSEAAGGSYRVGTPQRVNPEDTEAVCRFCGGSAFFFEPLGPDDLLACQPCYQRIEEAN
jgi:hypothetical protein